MQKSFFEATFFAGNRKTLVERSNLDLIVVTANGQMQRSADIAYPFQQDTHFWYLTGVDDPQITLVIDKGEAFLILPQQSEYTKIFDGAHDHDELQKISGITKLMPHEAGWEHLAEKLRAASQVGTILPPPRYIDVYDFYSNPARKDLVNRIKHYNDGAELVDLRMNLIEMRSIKQDPELAAIKRAISVTRVAYGELVQQLQECKFEYEVEAVLYYGFRKRGAAHAYDPIVASGANACTLHYDANNSALKKGDLLLVDAAATVDHYSADVTRTYTIHEPTARQAAVYEAVRDVQDFALLNLRAGVSRKEYEKMVEAYMGEHLRALGLIKEITKENIRRYYSHATSHGLGLDLHDPMDYDASMQPGNVLTVEPGIYIPQEGIGVRIEDDVLVTARGNKVLTSDIPKPLYPYA